MEFPVTRSPVLYIVNMDSRQVIASVDSRTMPRMVLEGMMDLMACLSGGQDHMLLDPSDIPDDIHNNSFEFLCVETTLADVKAWSDAVHHGVLDGRAKEMPDEDIHMGMAIREAIADWRDRRPTQDATASG